MEFSRSTTLMFLAIGSRIAPRWLPALSRGGKPPSRAKAKRIPLLEPGRSTILDANVLRFVRDAIGDPRLTWWEANFVNGMANWVAPTGPGAHLLTEKQWAVITRISAKLEAAPVEGSG